MYGLRGERCLARGGKRFGERFGQLVRFFGELGGEFRLIVKLLFELGGYVLKRFDELNKLNEHVERYRKLVCRKRLRAAKQFNFAERRPSKLVKRSAAAGERRRGVLVERGKFMGRERKQVRDMRADYQKQLRKQYRRMDGEL